VNLAARALAVVFAALFVASSSSRADGEDPCASNRGLEDSLNELLGEEFVDVARSIAGEESRSLEAAASEEAKLRPQGEGAGGGGLDLYKKLFVGLELGSLSQDDGALTFNFRPDLLDLERFGATAIRAIVRDPELHEPLATALDDLTPPAGTEARKALEESLGDTDDVEYQLRWSFGDASPDAAAEELAREIFEKSSSGAVREAASAAAGEISDAMDEIQRLIPDADESTPLSRICGTAGGRQAVERAHAAVKEKIAGALTLLGSNLDALNYVAVGDLVTGEPAVALDVSYRDRAEVVGPSSFAAKLHFQRGDRSTGSWKRWANRTGRGLDAASLADYLAGKDSIADGQTSILATAEYTETERFRFNDAGLDLTLDRPRVKVRAAALTLGRKLGDKRGSRLDLEAKYEDATGDPERNDRFVSTLSWTQKLSDEVARLAGGSNLVVALVYANRPEYLGEVDQDLSVRAGLKWSIEGAD
jgi:hypothetical protein